MSYFADEDPKARRGKVSSLRQATKGLLVPHLNPSPLTMDSVLSPVVPRPEVLEYYKLGLFNPHDLYGVLTQQSKVIGPSHSLRAPYCLLG